jgi:hypothetical protein
MRVEDAPTAGYSISPSRPRVSSLLEIGGGVGKLQIELLKRGAARAVDLELSAAYEQEAKSLLREAGLEERAERRLHDIAMDPEGVEAADVVVLHRVVCCYPDYERLLGRAAQHARRLLVFSYPPRNARGVRKLSPSDRNRSFAGDDRVLAPLRGRCGGSALPPTAAPGIFPRLVGKRLTRSGARSRCR